MRIEGRLVREADVLVRADFRGVARRGLLSTGDGEGMKSPEVGSVVGERAALEDLLGDANLSDLRANRQCGQQDAECGGGESCAANTN
jgi:hypothetical protein